VNTNQYLDQEKWAKLKALELEICTRPELLGMGLHLLFVGGNDVPRRQHEDKGDHQVAVLCFARDAEASNCRLP
jgi:hypothetical protein